jgi:hypothetical protein
LEIENSLDDKNLAKFILVSNNYDKSRAILETCGVEKGRRNGSSTQKRENGICRRNSVKII